MSKFINEPILVRLDPQTQRPRSFVWRQRRYDVWAIGSEWHETGKWWEGDQERVYLRALAGNGAAYDLCYDSTFDRWLLHTLHD